VTAASEPDAHRFSALSNGADANFYNKRLKATALCFAIVQRSHELVFELLRAGADVDLLLPSGARPLSAAVGTHDADMVALLLAAGADPNLATTCQQFDDDDEPTTPLFDAVRLGLFEIGHLLVSSGAVWSARLTTWVSDHAEVWLAHLANAAAAKREVDLLGFQLVRPRALQIACGLQQAELPAPILALVIECACEPFAANLPYHFLWDTVVAVKHFHTRPRVPLAVDAPARDHVAAARSERARVVAETMDKWAAKWQNALTLRRAGRYRDACVEFQALRAASAALPGEHTLHLEIDAEIACCVHEFDPVRAKAAWERLIDAIYRVNGLEGDDITVMHARNFLAIALTKLGDHAAAKCEFERVLEWRRANLHPDDAQTLAAAKSLASAMIACGDMSGGRAVLASVLAAETRKLGAADVETRLTAAKLAAVLRELGDLAGAAALDESHGVAAAAGGAKDPTRALAIARRGLDLHKESNWTDGNALMRDALATLKRVESDSQFTMRLQHELAFGLEKVGDFVAAQQLLEELLPERRRVMGDDHHATLATAHNLGVLRHKHDDRAGAVALLRETVAGRTRVFGAEGLKTISSRHELGVALFKQGDLAGALETLSPLLDARRRVGGDPKNTLATQSLLVRVLIFSGELARAKALAADLVEQRQRIPDADVAAALLLLAEACRLRGELDEALVHAQSALAKAAGDDSEARRELALVRRDQGFIGEARAILEAIVGALSAADDERKWLILRADLGATLLLIPSEHESAKLALASVAEAMERVFGATHFRTAAVRAQLDKPRPTS
jgi:tetratricopeptide (TPR) repeat protein